MACNDYECDECRPYMMVEWGLVRGYHMREEDDEGVGGVKRLEAPQLSPFGWLRKVMKR
jgi:hypothetical protein